MIQASQTVKGYSLAFQGLQTLDERTMNAGRVGLDRGLLITVGVVQRSYLKGPRPAKLGEVTGRLLRSISRRIEPMKTMIKGDIGTNVSYGGYHEFGFHGSVQVKSHTRVVKRIYQDKTIGPISLGERFVKGGGSGGKKASKAQRTGIVTFEFVRAHSRNVDYAGRPFVKPALNVSLPIILGEVDKEILATMNQGGSNG